MFWLSFVRTVFVGLVLACARKRCVQTNWKNRSRHMHVCTTVWPRILIVIWAVSPAQDSPVSCFLGPSHLHDRTRSPVIAIAFRQGCAPSGLQLAELHFGRFVFRVACFAGFHDILHVAVCFLVFSCFHCRFLFERACSGFAESVALNCSLRIHELVLHYFCAFSRTIAPSELLA